MPHALRAALAAALAALASAQGMPQWIPSGAKDLFGELDEVLASSKAAVLGDEACEIRTKLLKLLGPETGPEKPQIMLMILGDLGHCELRNGKHAAAMRRFQSAISELNAPSEDALLQSPQTAPVVLMSKACQYLSQHEATRAAVEIRRARTIGLRERAKIIKSIMKQNQVPEAQMDVFLQQIEEKSKAGGQEGQQVKGIARVLNSLDAIQAHLTNVLGGIDDSVAGSDEIVKKRKRRLVTGSGPFVPGLLMEPTTAGDWLPAAAALAEKASAIAKEVKDAKLTSSVSLLKRTKEGSGCSKLPITCETIKAQPDLSTNGFGETRVLTVKPSKQQSLDLCDTNGNVLVLLSVDTGVTLAVEGAETQTLEPGSPIVADHCRTLSLSVTGGAPVSVLLAQGWHPEVATIERTTEVRDRASKWGLKDAEVKEVTKALNTHGKKSGDAAAKRWREAPAGERLKTRLESAESKRRSAKEAADKEADEKARDDDEDRKKGLEQLEEKRRKQKQRAEEKERKRLQQQKIMEEERAKKDPWLRDPLVKEAEKKLEDLKQERRDANAKLEFDLTKQLTQDINAQERAVAKAIKKAKKAWKKGQKEGKPADSDGVASEAVPEASSGSSGVAAELEAAEKKLEDLRKRKAAAAENEDFKLAKQLKREQEVLEKEVAALRVKSEL